MIYRFLTFVLLIALPAAAQQAPSGDKMTLRTRDAHQNLLVVADPYLAGDRYTAQFGKKSPYEAGIVAIDVYFRNDNDSPIRMDLDTIRLMISQPGEERQRLSPLPPEDVADRTLLKAHANPPATRRPLSLPGSGVKSGKGKAWDEMATTLRSVALSTEVLPPHQTIHGFLFFDMNHQFDAIRNARVYIPDLSFMADKRPLFFFEIDLSDAP